MSIPYNRNLDWYNYQNNPNLDPRREDVLNPPIEDREDTQGVFTPLAKQMGSRSVQFIRDGARLVLKVPVRSLLTPVFLPKNWKERERAKINAKLAGYAFVQLLIVPVKFAVALTTLSKLGNIFKNSNAHLSALENLTDHLDGRAAQLEALKEVGRVHANNREEYQRYKSWLYSKDPRNCRLNG